ncbi:hypothetical protein N566_19525, partial [Streptomycetaceae bacterium MP113-05]
EAEFPPVFAGRGRGRQSLRRLLRHRRRILAACLALAAAGTALTAARTQQPTGGSAAGSSTVAARPAGQRSPDPSSPPEPGSGSRRVSAPVRIADPAAVELLRTGDRVDVIAAGAVPETSGGSPVQARLVARHALVERVPQRVDDQVSASSARGALIVLSVPRRTATMLAGASAVSPLAVTLC